jgi:hypothetical protein
MAATLRVMDWSCIAMLWQGFIVFDPMGKPNSAIPSRVL